MAWPGPWPDPAGRVRRWPPCSRSRPRTCATEASAAALAEVRATAVRAVLPLGLCLLPAFALLGIAPIVGGLLPSL